MASKIDSNSHEITCCMCHQHFNEPISLLPCGENICDSCLAEKSKVFKCQICKKNHKVPKNGFPKQSLKFENNNDAQKGLNEVLAKFEAIVNETSRNVDESEQKVQAQCDYMKDEIEISVESVICELSNLKSKLIAEIDDYQEKCRNNIKNENVEDV